MTTMTCPHRKTVEIENFFGVICYMHTPGGDSCTLMNNFNTSVDRICTVTIKKYEWENTPEVRAALSITGGQVETLLYTELSTRKDQDLADLLFFVISTYTSYTNRLNYFKSLVSAFGMQVVENIKFLVGEDFSPLYQQGDKKPLPMQDLRSAMQQKQISAVKKDISNVREQVSKVIDQTRKTRFS